MKKKRLFSSLICILICFSNEIALAQNKANVIGKTSMNKSAFESTSLFSLKLTSIPRNSEFEVLEQRKAGNFSWFKVNYQGITGWITDTGILIQKKAINQNQLKNQVQALSTGAALLFKEVNSRLSDEEKNSIFLLLKFSVSKDKEMFCLSIDKEKKYPFTVDVFPTDLNKDGIEEIFIGYGNTFTSGVTGSSTSLIIKGRSGKYDINFDTEGGLPLALTNSINGYPDILIPGRGYEYPVLRWNGSKYIDNRQVSDTQLKNMRKISINLLSKVYQNQLSTQLPKTEAGNVYTNTNPQKTTEEQTYLAPVDSVAHDSPLVKLVGKIVTAQRNIVVYNRPNINQGEPLLILRKNTSVKIEQEYSEIREKWYKITTSGITGWINAENTKLNH